MSKQITRGLVLVSLVLVGCDRASETVEVTDPADMAAAQLVQQQGATDRSLVQTIPGFGGLFLRDGKPTVYLTDLAQSGRARRLLANYALQQGAAADEIVVLQGRFRFDELEARYNGAWSEAMAVAGAVFSDLDEANNRLLFGVEHAGAANAVRGVLARLNVPASMVEVRVVPSVHAVATLRDKVDPKVGGLQIHFSQYLCTLGFNAQFGTTQSFITNSHCTTSQGGTEGTVYYQPTSTVSPTSIATEVSDPEYFRGGACPRGKKCRYSDSSRANYKAGVAVDQGGIAATNGSGLTITGTHNITAESDQTTSPVPVGGIVSKTGRTTGTSSGKVTNTCVNTAVSGSNIMQLCQTFVAAAVGAGDSGSPVYTGSGSVALVGILWGGSSTGASFVFSPLKSIKTELGSFSAR